MKLNTVGITLAILAAVGTVQAVENRGFYVGAGAGQSNFESRVVTGSVPPQEVKIKDSATSVRVFGGYRMARWLSVEAGWASYGDISEALASGSNAPSFEASFAGWDAALVGNIPIADDRFGIFVKIGVARTNFETLIFDPTDLSVARDTRRSERQTTALGGLGFQFNLGEDRNHGIRLEYDVFDVSLLATDQTNIQLAYVYRF